MDPYFQLPFKRQRKYSSNRGDGAKRPCFSDDYMGNSSNQYERYAYSSQIYNRTFQNPYCESSYRNDYIDQLEINEALPYSNKISYEAPFPSSSIQSIFSRFESLTDESAPSLQQSNYQENSAQRDYDKVRCEFTADERDGTFQQPHFQDNSAVSNYSEFRRFEHAADERARTSQQSNYQENSAHCNSWKFGKFDSSSEKRDQTFQQSHPQDRSSMNHSRKFDFSTDKSHGTFQQSLYHTGENNRDLPYHLSNSSLNTIEQKHNFPIVPSVLQFSIAELRKNRPRTSIQDTCSFDKKDGTKNFGNYDTSGKLESYKCSYPNDLADFQRQGVGNQEPVDQLVKLSGDLRNLIRKKMFTAEKPKVFEAKGFQNTIINKLPVEKNNTIEIMGNIQNKDKNILKVTQKRKLAKKKLRPNANFVNVMQMKNDSPIISFLNTFEHGNLIFRYDKFLNELDAVRNRKTFKLEDSRLEKELGRNIVAIGCGAHNVHNCLQTAVDVLPIEIEALFSVSVFIDNLNFAGYTFRLSGLFIGSTLSDTMFDDKKEIPGVMYSCHICGFGKYFTYDKFRKHLAIRIHKQNMIKYVEKLQTYENFIKATVAYEAYKEIMFASLKVKKMDLKIRKCQLCRVVVVDKDHTDSAAHQIIKGYAVPSCMPGGKKMDRSTYEAHLFSPEHFIICLNRKDNVDKVKDHVFSSRIEDSTSIPPYDSQNGVGKKFIVNCAKCEICNDTFSKEDALQHCSSEKHYRKFISFCKANNSKTQDTLSPSNSLVSQEQSKDNELIISKPESNNGSETDKNKEPTEYWAYADDCLLYEGDDLKEFDIMEEDISINSPEVTEEFFSVQE